MATPQWFIDGMTKRGMAPHVIEAFGWNFDDESGFDPNINEIAPLVPGSRGGFGISQWTGPRRRALEAFAAERGVSPGNPDLQMDFLMYELQGPERAAWEAIQAAPDTQTAAAAIVNKFLRPAEVNRAKRESAYLGGKATGVTASEYGGNALAGPAGPPVAPHALAQQPPQFEWTDMRMDPSMFLTSRRNSLAYG